MFTKMQIIASIEFLLKKLCFVQNRRKNSNKIRARQINTDIISISNLLFIY